jgi:hypothetical protein
MLEKSILKKQILNETLMLLIFPYAYIVISFYL